MSKQNSTYLGKIQVKDEKGGVFLDEKKRRKIEYFC